MYVFDAWDDPRVASCLDLKVPYENYLHQWVRKFGLRGKLYDWEREFNFNVCMQMSFFERFKSVRNDF